MCFWRWRELVRVGQYWTHCRGPPAGRHGPRDARQWLFRFYDAVHVADITETTRLAETVQAWSPAVEGSTAPAEIGGTLEGGSRRLDSVAML